MIIVVGCRHKKWNFYVFFFGNFHHSLIIISHFDCFHIYDLTQPVSWSLSRFISLFSILFLVIIFFPLFLFSWRGSSFEHLDALSVCYSFDIQLIKNLNNKQEIALIRLHRLKTWNESIQKRTSSVWNVKNVNYLKFLFRFDFHGKQKLKLIYRARQIVLIYFMCTKRVFIRLLFLLTLLKLMLFYGFRADF